VHARAAITLFDEILESVFGERLASHLPERVLPISTKPIVGVDILIDEQYAQIEDLLKPASGAASRRGRCRAARSPSKGTWPGTRWSVSAT
jgi:hypothetical protein